MSSQGRQVPQLLLPRKLRGLLNKLNTKCG
jgi:hypothetical protein